MVSKGARFWSLVPTSRLGLTYHFSQNLEVWLEAKKEIDKIEPHPNQPPQELVDAKEPGSDESPDAGPSRLNGAH